MEIRFPDLRVYSSFILLSFGTDESFFNNWGKTYGFFATVLFLNKIIWSNGTLFTFREIFGLKNLHYDTCPAKVESDHLV